MSTLPEWWTVPYPEVTSVESAAAYLDALGGAINRAQDNGSWVLSTGRQELVRSGSQAELDSFLLGFALAHLICERHGPIGRRAPAPEAEAAPREAAELAEAEGGTAYARAAEPGADDSDESETDTEAQPEPERVSLSVVPNSSNNDNENDTEDDIEDDDEDDDATDAVTTDDDEDGEAVRQGVGEGTGAPRRRRRRR